MVKIWTIVLTDGTVIKATRNLSQMFREGYNYRYVTIIESNNKMPLMSEVFIPFASILYAY